MKPPFKTTNKVINLVAQITEELGKIQGTQLSSPGPKLRKQNRIKTIQATLAIEGNTLNIDQITAVLEGRKVLGPQKEIIEVQNAVQLYEDIQDYKAFSLKDLLKAHKKLMATLIKTSGKFRSTNVGVLKGSQVSHLAPKPALVPELVDNLFKWAKSEKELHPLIKSCIIHYELEFIHPFEDGNGRIGRFWQTLVLSKYNQIFSYLPIESLIKDNQQKYYKTLEKCDKAGNSTAFIEFILELVLKAIQDFSKGVTSVVLDSSSRLDGAKKHFGEKLFSRKEYMIYFKNISSATASRDLRDGVDEGILKKSGEGNLTRYCFTD
ncbi:MAG: cell filamentation protein Fic [Halobacteriovorax sp.]|nr:cell filamentation protein Fic [Halobacteriovorax sp.]